MIRIYIYWPKQPDGRGYCPAPVLATCRDALNLDLLDSEEDLAAVAERDDWDYSLDCILEHRPAGPRKRRAKSSYEFLVLYKYLDRSTEPGQENPCWQPYRAVAHTEALQRYCERAEVISQLGSNFYSAEAEQPPRA